MGVDGENLVVGGDGDDTFGAGLEGAGTGGAEDGLVFAEEFFEAGAFEGDEGADEDGEVVAFNFGVGDEVGGKGWGDLFEGEDAGVDHADRWQGVLGEFLEEGLGVDAGVAVGGVGFEDTGLIEAGIEANYFSIVLGAEVGEAADGAAAEDGLDKESPVHGKSPDMQKARGRGVYHGLGVISTCF